jgi:type IV secretion system protein VirB8
MSTDVQRYLEDSAGWDADWRRQEQRLRTLAFGAAVTASVLAAIAGTALCLLLPLKRVEPYVIRVDNASGVVDVVPTYAGIASFPEAVTRYLLTHYVATCERYLSAVAEEDYSECGAFHAPQRNQEWAAHWATGNPDSPLNRFRDGTTVKASIAAVSFFERGTGLTDLAQVRFSRVTRPGGSGAEQRSHWIATIHYQFGKPSTDEALRRWNPLGFRVLDYHVEPEVLDGTPGGTLSATAAATPTATATTAATP